MKKYYEKDNGLFMYLINDIFIYISFNHIKILHRFNTQCEYIDKLNTITYI